MYRKKANDILKTRAENEEKTYLKTGCIQGGFCSFRPRRLRLVTQLKTRAENELENSSKSL